MASLSTEFSAAQRKSLCCDAESKGLRFDSSLRLGFFPRDNTNTSFFNLSICFYYLICRMMVRDQFTQPLLRPFWKNHLVTKPFFLSFPFHVGSTKTYVRTNHFVENLKRCALFSSTATSLPFLKSGAAEKICPSLPQAYSEKKKTTALCQAHDKQSIFPYGSTFVKIQSLISCTSRTRDVFYSSLSLLVFHLLRWNLSIVQCLSYFFRLFIVSSSSVLLHLYSITR